ncbi:MAG: aminotransferase class I/II-fold pyridoxal phosphate-dependent enzyme, partial [Halobacteriaceae archaeon]
MDIAPFGLERWFTRHEHTADIMLAESGIRSLPADRFDTDPGELGYVIPTNGDPDLRAAVGDRYDRDAEEVLFTCGTQEANFLAFLALLDADDHAVVVTPTYQALHAVPDAVADVTTVSLSPPDWHLDVDAVADAIRPDTQVIVLNNPNNPTGRYHDRATVDALYDLAVDADAYLLCDEVYRGLAEDPLPPVASLGAHGISTTSLTKAYGLAGTRFGWLVGPRDLVDAAWQWKDYTTISPSIFGQHIARQALGDMEATILAENRDLAATNRGIVADWLAAHDLAWYDPVGVNGFPTIPEGYEDARSFCTTVVE